MFTNPSSSHSVLLGAEPVQKVRPGKSREPIRTEWSRQMQRYEKALGGRASLCVTLGGLPDSVYAAWKAGEVPPEWMQAVIRELLDSELAEPPVNAAHPFE